VISATFDTLYVANVKLTRTVSAAFSIGGVIGVDFQKNDITTGVVVRFLS
jgi:hypothetical protein